MIPVSISLEKEGNTVSEEPQEEFPYVPQKPFLKAAEIAKILGLNRMTIYNMIERGTLPGAQEGKIYLVAREDFIDYLRRLRARQQAKKKPE